MASSQGSGKGWSTCWIKLSRRLPPGVGDSLLLSRRSSQKSRTRLPLEIQRRSSSAVRSPTPTAGDLDFRRRDRSSRESASTFHSPASATCSPDRRPRLVVMSLRMNSFPHDGFLRRADAVRASVWIVARLAEGLEHAHSRGLLRRDLKPSNILIAADGTADALDFNLSVEAEPDDEHTDDSFRRTILGGTLLYMAHRHLDALTLKYARRRSRRTVGPVFTGADSL